MVISQKRPFVTQSLIFGVKQNLILRKEKMSDKILEKYSSVTVVL